VTKRLKLGSSDFHSNVAQCLKSLPAKFDYEIRRSPLDREAQTAVGWFSIEFAMLYLGNGEDRAKVTINHLHEVIYGLSIATKVDDLE